MQRGISRSSKSFSKECHARLLAVVILLSGCALGCVSPELKNPPPCPGVTEEVVGDLDRMISTSEYEDLELWISEVERYCSAIDSI